MAPPCGQPALRRDPPSAAAAAPVADGRTADLGLPQRDQGEALAAFFAALHRPAPDDAPRNPVRGVPLADRAAGFDLRVHALAERGEMLDPRLLALWADGLAAPMDAAPTWIHGDLHPRNVLTVDGRFSAALDWGDMARGDRASDLAAIWMLLPDPDSRRCAIAAMPEISDATWRRARAWAVSYGVLLLASGLDGDAPMATIARRIFAHLLSGP